MSVLTNYIDLVKVCVEEGIDIIFSGAGLPLDLPKYITEGSKTKLVPIVSSSRAAMIIAKKWHQNYNYLPDAFVVEGPEAGGHLGFSFDDLAEEKTSLKELVVDVLKISKGLEEKYDVKIPVIAGGGVVTGCDIKELFDLGVSAVQLGTSFVATEECDASGVFKQALVDAESKDIRLIQSPVGLPGRAIENDFLVAADNGNRRPKSCKYHCIKSCNPKTTNYCIADALYYAYYGKFDQGFAFSGAQGYRVKSITTVEEVFTRLQKEFADCSK